MCAITYEDICSLSRIIWQAFAANSIRQKCDSLDAWAHECPVCIKVQTGLIQDLTPEEETNLEQVCRKKNGITGSNKQ